MPVAATPYRIALPQPALLSNPAITVRSQCRLREAEIANVPFLGALAGCSARRSERRVASHTSEEQRRNAPGSADKNGILDFSASLTAVFRLNKPKAH